MFSDLLDLENPSMLDQHDPYIHVTSDLRITHTALVVGIPLLDFSGWVQHTHNDTYLRLYTPTLLVHLTRHLSWVSYL